MFIARPAVTEAHHEIRPWGHRLPIAIGFAKLDHGWAG
jgi:hypothetical protein